MINAESFSFKTKAQTLELIYNNLNTAKALPVFRFCLNKFLSNKNLLIDELCKYFKDETLVAVRSSSNEEDGSSKSNAGAFDSVLNVDISNRNDLENAIQKVLASYKNRKEKDEIFIQPMVKNVKMAGVAFTCDVSTLAPYYVINYDESGKTDSITSGSINDTKTLFIYKDSSVSSIIQKNINLNLGILKLIKTLQELEEKFNNKFIDVEFAIDNNDEVYILQVRPIVTKNKKYTINLELEEGLSKIYKKIKKLQQPHPNLFGTKAIFGVMPDWNPAEIIGVKPKKLALSLYKELVTDNIWAYQRDNYGYRNLRSHPLLVSFMGVPFVDVRVDFNSFIPKKLDKTIASKLVEYYLAKLYKIPKFHDKVEFEIVHSCFHLNLKNKLTDLQDNGFSQNEIEQIELSLLELTNNIISPQKGLYKKDLEKISILETKYDQIVHSDLPIIDKIYWLLEDCKRYGTLPFAGIARAAFIAVQFLKSFVEMNIISQKDYDNYLNSLNTVSKQLVNDLKTSNKEDFLEKWGHLRPGTYDITSLRYDEGYDFYFSSVVRQEVEETNKFNFSKEQLNKIQQKIKDNGLKISVNELIVFIKESIEGREYSKLVFTKTLSKVLVLIEELGAKYDISRDEMAFSNIKLIQDLYCNLDFRELKTILADNIAFNKKLYEYTSIIKLPSVILNPEDIYGFYLEEEEPNFITLNSITSEIILEKDIEGNDLKGKIVFIPSADPGYDFLFTKNIGALITQFGGANSHMAIRCAELGIPAIIGAGEKKYEEWSASNQLHIDCANKQVKIIS